MEIEQSDLASDIAKAMGEVEESELQTDVVDEPPVETSTDTTRDEQGRFTKQENKEQVVEPEPVKTEVKAEPNPEWQRLGLRKEDAEVWEKADPRLKEVILRRNEEMFRGIDQYKNDAQFGQSLNKVISPYLPVLNSLGATPEQAVKELLNADYKLRFGGQQEKEQLFAELARSYGIDLNQVVAEQPHKDPGFSKLEGEIAQLKNFISNQQMATSQNEEQDRLSTVGEFLQQNPDAERLGDEFGYQIAVVRQANPQMPNAEVLKQAYERAKWAHPETRQGLLKQQQEESSRKANEEAVAKSAAAKRAGFDVRGQGGMGVSSGETDSLRETILAAMGKN